MASGHVNRIRRPNTWLHRPMLQNVKKSSCQPGGLSNGSRCLEDAVRPTIAIPVAKTAGFTIPEPILLRAEKVIE